MDTNANANVIFSDWLRYKIINLGLSPYTIDDKIGLSYRTVQFHLAGTHRPRDEAIRKYAEFFKIEPYLLHRMVCNEYDL